MLPRKIDCPAEKAEGRCCGVPYNTELVNSNGVAFHLWLGDQSPDRLPELEAAARRTRDVVYVTWSDGMPTGFWAHQDIA